MELKRSCIEYIAPSEYMVSLASQDFGCQLVPGRLWDSSTFLDTMDS
jgi:hypothetical protein